MANTPQQNYQKKINDAVASGQITPAQGADLTKQLNDNTGKNGQLGSELRTSLNQSFRQFRSTEPGETEEERRRREEAEREAERQRQLEAQREGSRPGGAWVWDGTRWVRPGRPSDGRPYTWDDNLGWQLDDALINSRTNSRNYLEGLFKQFGFTAADITSLMGLVDGWVQSGLADAGTEPVLMKFRDTDIYKRRFAGMAELIGRGQAISEADYVALESSYRNVMQNYGLPDTYYDNYDDYARLIGAGLSVREVEERVIGAKQAMNPLVAQELREYYNISDGDLTAYMLGLTDDKGLQLASARNQEQIRKQGRAAQIGAAAERAGFAMDREYAERLGGTSIGQTIDPFQMETLSRLEGTFDQARRVATRETTLAGIDQETYDQRDALAASFGDEQARLASQRRAKRERGRFAGSAGAAQTALGVERNF